MINIDVFPDRINFGQDEVESQNLQIQLYGRRVRKDQTFYEYLIEFLLVFTGKCGEETGFYKIKNYNKPISYEYVNNIALKRFIFLKDSKKDNVYDIDKQANKILEEKLKSNIEGSLRKDEVISIIRELYLGFVAYSGDRGWFAKAFLPIDKTTIFPEAMGKKGVRKTLKLYNEKNKFNCKVDEGFEFKEHNFMARGGEVYFLHLIQGFKYIRENNIDDDIKIKKELDYRLNKLITSFPQIRELSTWIDETWTNIKKKNDCDDDEQIKYTCKWIPKSYERRSQYTVKELLNILRAEISEFDKFDLLSIIMIIQILRMMTEAATLMATENKEYNSPWIIHVNSINNDKVKKLAVESYKNVEENMIVGVSKVLDNFEKIKDNSIRKTTTESSLLKDAYDDSHKLLRFLGKKIGLVIPIKGNNMRFTLTDNIVKVFVLSLVEPGKKITLNTFINKLYKNFGIIIGPKEYEEYLKGKESLADTSYLHYNLEEFQVLLRKNGFLKELSDATSIVINPYSLEKISD